jgi:protein-S-isoprenylcysteine O-methyltransferase
LWAIGTQIVLLNPVSFVLYICATFKFFNERIPEEEMNLVEFFGTDYIDYASRTRTWMPFVDTWADKLEN